MKTIKNPIAVICYDELEFWQSRKKAIEFYQLGAFSCDGHEAERYWNIVCDLMADFPICLDDRYMHAKAGDILRCCAATGRVKQFPNGTNFRDYDGEVSYPIREKGVIGDMTFKRGTITLTF